MSSILGDSMEYISRMVAPSVRRPTAYMGGIVQVHVTRACDKACINCTQGSNLRGKPTFMSPDKFEEAISTLVDYFGVVGVFGGNPAISPFFEDYCSILRSYIPKKRCGLWCNNLLGKGAAARATFNPAHSNLNVHMDRDAYEEFQRDWPEAGNVVGLETDSRHSPTWISFSDVEADEEARWKKIVECDINRYWSSMIGLFRGELRAWFCEIAGAQAINKQEDPRWPDTGVAVVPGWWKAPIQDYADQVRFHCHRCGVPLRGAGDLAVTGTKEQTSPLYADIYLPKNRSRVVEIVTDVGQLDGSLDKMTDYIGNASKETPK